MSVLKRKSSIALIVGIIIILLLIPLWYMMLAPSIIASEIEKTDVTTSYEGTLDRFGIGRDIPILIEAHAYVEEVKGDNIILKIEANMMNMTNPDNPNRLEEFSYNLTYVINKFTLENVPDAPDADKNRTGYDPLYPLHLKAGENISKAWLDNLNVTATLEFKGSQEEEGVELYKYFVNETRTIETVLTTEGEEIGLRNVTVTNTKTLLIEPLSGALAYTENETITVYMGWKQDLYHLKLVDLTYKSPVEAKTEGIALAKTTYEGLQLLELYIPTIFGLVATILIVGLALNVRRLKGKAI